MHSTRQEKNVLHTKIIEIGCNRHHWNKMQSVNLNYISVDLDKLYSSKKCDVT